MSQKPFSLYVHVPFCAHKCPYCDFNTYATPAAPEADYVRALKSEIAMYASDSRFAGRQLATIFFGGGTPSLLSPDAIGEIINAARQSFGLIEGAEVTLEANPSEPSTDRYRGYRDSGVNRVSFGVQSFHQSRLELLGRDHSVDDAKQAVRQCVEAGIPNVSVDIIFGVSGQTISDLEHDLDTALLLPISHLSTYALTIEPGTPFFQRQERGLLSMPPDETVAAMLDAIPARMSASGFARYEISNYAKLGCESRHNEVYWIGGDYLGIGAGAHSYSGCYEGALLVKGERWSTLALPASYMKAAGTPSTVSWRESLSVESLQFEFFYLGLRRICGVSLPEFEKRFGVSARAIYGKVLKELGDEGFLNDNGETVSLTTNGIALADSIYERFLT